MLARNFLTAQDLGITERERAALVQTLGMLERGEIQYAAKDHARVPNGFNMRVWDCGTTHCILGWARHLDAQAHPADEWSFQLLTPGLLALCYPSLLGGWSKPRMLTTSITPEHAARALRDYLTTGQPDWNAATA